MKLCIGLDYNNRAGWSYSDKGYLTICVNVRDSCKVYNGKVHCVKVVIDKVVRYQYPIISLPIIYLSCMTYISSGGLTGQI